MRGWYPIGFCIGFGSAKNETKPKKVRPIYSADLITGQGLRKLNEHAVRSPDTCATYNGQELNVNQLLDSAANFQEGTVSVNADLSRCSPQFHRKKMMRRIAFISTLTDSNVPQAAIEHALSSLYMIWKESSLQRNEEWPGTTVNPPKLTSIPFSFQCCLLLKHFYTWMNSCSCNMARKSCHIFVTIFWCTVFKTWLVRWTAKKSTLDLTYWRYLPTLIGP